jgi:hypothetical protein
MKIEAKHLDLGDKIGKIALLTGMFLYVFQGFFGGAWGIILAAFGVVTVIAYALKLFLTKGENILNLLVIFGGIGYIFLRALILVVVSANLALAITLMIVSILLLAGLMYELITKKGLDSYEKYITGLMIFLFGMFIASGWAGPFGIIGIILVALGFVLLVAVIYFRGTASSE